MTEARFLLDSNICIHVLSGVPPVVRQRIEAIPLGELATSAIAYAEVMFGARSLVNRDQAEMLFQIVTVLPFDAAAGLQYAQLPFRRASFDRLIAAHALALDLTLVTANERHFADLPGLRVENWTRPL